MKIHVLPSMMNYSAPTEKETKGGKKKKAGKHKYHSQNARINLIILEFLWKYILMFFSTQEVWPLFT